MFCDRCGSLVLPKGKKLICTRCGYEKKGEFKLTQENKRENKLVILDEEVRTMPTTRVECPKCKNLEAEWWLVQTRGLDEPETRFLRCTKCKFTWREYE